MRRGARRDPTVNLVAEPPKTHRVAADDIFGKVDPECAAEQHGLHAFFGVLGGLGFGLGCTR